MDNSAELKATTDMGDDGQTGILSTKDEEYGVKVQSETTTLEGGESIYWTTYHICLFVYTQFVFHE